MPQPDLRRDDTIMMTTDGRAFNYLYQGEISLIIGSRLGLREAMKVEKKLSLFSFK